MALDEYVHVGLRKLENCTEKGTVFIKKVIQIIHHNVYVVCEKIEEERLIYVAKRKKQIERKKLVELFRRDIRLQHPNALTGLNICLQGLVASLKVCYPTVAKSFDELRRNVLHEPAVYHEETRELRGKVARHDAVLLLLYWLFKYRNYFQDGMEGHGIMSEAGMSVEQCQHIHTILEYYYHEKLESLQGASICAIWDEYGMNILFKS